jgi:hypothetical protein
MVATTAPRMAPELAEVRKSTSGREIIGALPWWSPAEWPPPGSSIEATASGPALWQSSPTVECDPVQVQLAGFTGLEVQKSESEDEMRGKPPYASPKPGEMRARARFAASCCPESDPCLRFGDSDNKM